MGKFCIALGAKSDIRGSSNLFAIDFIYVAGCSLGEVPFPEKAAMVVTMVSATSSMMSWVEVPVGIERRFLQELDALPGRLVPEKMAEFLRETQSKDTERMLQLQILGKETELRAREKDLFI
ncbi:hypothetical protein Tco_0642390 [Tanacetum coccineum]